MTGFSVLASLGAIVGLLLMIAFDGARSNAIARQQLDRLEDIHRALLVIIGEEE